MVFSSMVFLTFFLPIVFFIYLICPNRARNLFLFIASLVFYAWGEPVYIFIMLFSTVFDYVNGRLIEHFRTLSREKAARTVLVISVVGNLAILGFFKYTDFFIETIDHVSGSTIALLGLTLPVGISFYTFQTMSYTIDVYRGEVAAQHNIISFGMYVCLFPQLIAGPIVRYKDIAKEVDSRRFTPSEIALGMYRFAIGLSKKVLIANKAGDIYKNITAIHLSSLTGPEVLISAICYTIQIYFDFSGYSDMAIGLGRIFGFHFPENFNYPYESKSITEFWRRWHMTLGTWFREYVYIPLGGNRKGLARQILNLLIVWSLTGFWHGASWNFVLWGLYYFALLLIEKCFMLRVWKKLPERLGFIRILVTMVFVMCGWILFSHTDLTEAAYYMKTLFSPKAWTAGFDFRGGHVSAGYQTVYLFRSSVVLMTVGIIGATELPHRIFAWFDSKSKRRGEGQISDLQMLLSLILMLLAVMTLLSDSFNPFLYFRF
ncbi:MAG: MBOAT family protein [Lachnospiraceae bacterium]|nr:MBOAT family protein [Lachnospiraceae bacterium]